MQCWQLQQPWLPQKLEREATSEFEVELSQALQESQLHRPFLLFFLSNHCLRLSKLFLQHLLLFQRS